MSCEEFSSCVKFLPLHECAPFPTDPGHHRPNMNHFPFQFPKKVRNFHVHLFVVRAVCLVRTRGSREQPTAGFMAVCKFLHISISKLYSYRSRVVLGSDPTSRFDSTNSRKQSGGERERESDHMQRSKIRTNHPKILL